MLKLATSESIKWSFGVRLVHPRFSFSLSIHLPFFFLSFSLPVLGLSSKTSIPTSDPDQRPHSWHQRYAACSWSTQTTYATSAAIFGSEVATAGIDLAQLAAGPQGRRQHHRSDLKTSAFFSPTNRSHPEARWIWPGTSGRSGLVDGPEISTVWWPTRRLRVAPSSGT